MKYLTDILLLYIKKWYKTDLTNKEKEILLDKSLVKVIEISDNMLDLVLIEAIIKCVLFKSINQLVVLPDKDLSSVIKKMVDYLHIGNLKFRYCKIFNIFIFTINKNSIMITYDNLVKVNRKKLKKLNISYIYYMGNLSYIFNKNSLYDIVNCCKKIDIRLKYKLLGFLYFLINKRGENKY